jgi:hypothetical protein
VKKRGLNIAQLWGAPEPLLPFQIHSQPSIDAAASVKPNAHTLRETIFMAISNAPTGLTDEELSIHTGILGNTERPRRIELQQAGRIVPAGTRATKSGRQATVWTVSRG